MSNTNREDFADYYWGDVHGIEREEFMRGRTNSAVQIVYSAWLAGVHAAKINDRTAGLSTVFLLLLWEAEQLSEGQLSKMLDIDRVTLRQMRIDAIEAGMKLAETLQAAQE